MKKLTLELYERIIDTFHEQTRNNLGLLGHVTRDECAEYIGFYAYHKGLFWCERDGKVLAVATAHPSKKQFDWDWGQLSDTWTTHCIWSSDNKYIKELLREFVDTYVVRSFYACRRGKLVHLTHKKLERILNYGRRRKISPATSGTSIQRVDEICLAVTDRIGPTSARARDCASAKVSTASEPNGGSDSEGSAKSLPATSA